MWVSETRPRNQGASLTAWELAAHGVPHRLVVDNACGHLLATGQVDIVFVGADRVAANGDAANKIGTYLKALAAQVANRRASFHVLAPDEHRRSPLARPGAGSRSRSATPTRSPTSVAWTTVSVSWSR